MDFTPDALPTLVEFVTLAHFDPKLKPTRPNALVNAEMCKAW